MRANGDKGASGAESQDSAPGAYCFAGFRLLANHQRLEFDGEPIALTTKQYHLLLTFLANPGQVLPKEAIVDAVWPGQVVTDAALAKQIQRLRSTLDDSEREPPLIETHRGRGYRLTCPVVIECESEAAPAAEETASVWAPLANAARGRRIAVFAMLGLAALAIALMIVPMGQESDTAAARSIAVVPVANQTTTLSEGAAEYLASRLGAPADLAPLLRSSEAPTQAIKLGSLELFRLRKAPVIALRLTRDEGSYHLWIDLRNGDGSSGVEFADESIANVLAQGEQWIRTHTGLPPAAQTEPAYALSSHFEGLASSGCDRAMPYFRAALTNNPDFANARLHLARCEQARGNSEEAAAAAIAVLNASTSSSDTGIALSARLIAAQAFRNLGDADAARAHLKAASEVVQGAASPLQELSALAVLALLANMDGNADEALKLHAQRLTLAREEYPLPAYLAGIRLDIAEIGLSTGDYAAMREQAEQARILAEEHGDFETLMRSYRYLITSYFRANDIDAAAQLALAAEPMLDRVGDVADKAFFMQFAALALNAQGHLVNSRNYTEQLRRLSQITENPLYGAIADTTVMHRLYIQNDFPRAHALAASTRARLENESATHSALPHAMVFEALAASRAAPPDVAQQLIDELKTRYAKIDALKGSILRASGHARYRAGDIEEGLRLLREAEAATRTEGSTGVADYIGYEIVGLRLEVEEAPPWDDINRLTEGRQGNYYLARLTARAHARDGNFLSATAALQEARLRGNELWSPEDQLLLEVYQSELLATRAD